MNNVKKYVVSLSIMIVVAIVSLVVVSTLTYLLKWQADKAMIGIIVTYVFAGVIGGNHLRKQRRDGQRKSIIKKMIEALLLATIFMFFSIICAYWGFQIPFEFSRRFLLIWLLIICSSLAGISIKG